MCEVPHVHDWYATNATFDGRRLKLLLQWVEYSKERRDFQVTEVRAICFLDVDDIDALPTQDSEPNVRPGFWGRLLGRLGRHYDLRKVKTVRQLVSQINSRGPDDWGEPLAAIDAVAHGFILLTHVSGEYYISARAVE